MITSLTALPTVFSIGLQRQFAYRWNYLLRALFSAMPLLVSWVFWGAVFHGKETVGPYTLASLLTYYAVLLVVESVSSPADDDFQISREIREGTLNSILLRPLPYGLYRGTLFLAGRCAYLVAALIPVALCFYLLSQVVSLQLGALDLARGIPALLGSALLQFSLTLCLSFTSFWLLDISALIFLVYSLEFLAGGHVFPLDLLPPTPPLRLRVLVSRRFPLWLSFSLRLAIRSSDAVGLGPCLSHPRSLPLEGWPTKIHCCRRIR